MRAKEYPLLQQCVEEGLAYGWNRAHKYTDNPTSEDIKTAMYDAVLGSICEWFDFDNGYEDE